MKRKGQYLPVETVLSFGLGLMIAIATITGFTTYRKQILDNAEQPQVNTVENRMSGALNTVYSMDDNDNFMLVVELPDKIAGRSYDLSLGEDRLKIAVGDDLYTERYPYLNSSMEMFGSASGGAVKVFKRQDQIILRDN